MKDAPKGASFDSVSKSLHCIPSSSLIPLNPHLGCEDTYVPVPYSNDHESRYYSNPVSDEKAMEADEVNGPQAEAMDDEKA
ncbi:hypothetical protein MTR67_020331 [Solanum verrucosum]|uniref:Uncharacterized protein n=1 Tax=Solanum verrucosum TaxID=315347 RepID=A0AAF0TP28_SOLVR|nr:hypothetical protein MTR67_020331 [Solanum verrucosum]